MTIGDFEKVIEYFTKGLNVYEKFKGYEGTNYLDTLNQLVCVYQLKGYYSIKLLASQK